MKEDSGLRSFVEDICRLDYEARRFFFEFFSDEEEISKDKEIILMDRVKLKSHDISCYSWEFILYYV